MAPRDETPAEQSVSTCEGKVLKVITKGWRHRAHPDPAAQPRPLMKRWRRRRRRSAGVFPRSSRRAALFLPHRLMVGVWEGGRRSISDHIWAFLRAHFTNGVLSMPVPPLPPRLISLLFFFERRNVNVSTTSPRCVWKPLLWPQSIYNVVEPDGYDERSDAICIMEVIWFGPAHGKMTKRWHIRAAIALRRSYFFFLFLN